MSDEAIRRVDKYNRASGYDRGTPNPPKTRRCNNCAHRQSEHGGDGQGYICKLMRKCVSMTHTCEQWKLWQPRSWEKA